MVETAVLSLADGARIVVPDSLDLITPYVLREQGDFFEDELPFVRAVLQPGQRVIDIGANYGVYTISIAKKVGLSGYVWAFEPSSSTAQFLAQSIAANGFEQVTLERYAVSSTGGSAQLGPNDHAELRALVRDATAQEDGERVALVTLDDYMNAEGWPSIDFIKIDAEGEESNIVTGGRRLFTKLDPLVQYELRNGPAEMNFDLIREFAAIGYMSYRLVHGLGVLIPFDSGVPPDPYLLNLFSCKGTRADNLAARGLLLRPGDLAVAGERADSSKHINGTKHYWRRALADMPYAVQLSPRWAKANEAAESSEICRALWHYARSRDTELSIADRFHSLRSSLLQLQALCDRQPSHLRLASLARAAHDYGARAVSVNALHQLLASIREIGTVDTSEPFLAPWDRFESISPGESLDKWVLAATLEHLEERESFSTFYVGPRCLERLEIIEALGYSGPEMQRRLKLVRARIDGALAAKRLIKAAPSSGS